MYNANKSGTGNGGLKWIQKGGGYYSECTKRLKELVPQYSERVNTEGMAVELAIRQWARSDEAAAAAVASVDAARLQNVGQLYRAAGLAAEEADAQAFLFYCFIFGQSLLFLERGPRKRAQLIAKSAEKLLSDED